MFFDSLSSEIYFFLHRTQEAVGQLHSSFPSAWYANKTDTEDANVTEL